MFCSRLSSARRSSSSSSPGSTESSAACCCPGPEYEMVSWSRTWARGHWTLDTLGHVAPTLVGRVWGSSRHADTCTLRSTRRRCRSTATLPTRRLFRNLATGRRLDRWTRWQQCKWKVFIELHVILFEHNKLLWARWCETKIIVTVDIRYYDLGL